MDSKEKRKQYYIDNRDRILERNKKYYHDNKDERQKYNREYWTSNGQKYVEKRMKDPDYVSKYTEYNKIYRERNKQYYYDNRQERLKYNNQYWSINGHKYKGRSKHIYQDNFFHATSLKDFIVTFD